ncbi:MAG: hypothetical protein NTW08_04645 [Gammaproteobacteria bacterium]|nr:hypothetical protein [Gammaproteobacteria bacterium]
MPTIDEIKRLLISDPDGFEALLQIDPGVFSLAFAEHLDANDPLHHLRDSFDLGELIPFAGHSLGPVFKPAIQAIDAIHQLQREQLHAAHFPETAEIGGNWFDCDVDPESVKAMQGMLGFVDTSEFVFTQSGLSANLGNLLDTFYRPTLKDWRNGKTKMCHLSTEFFSDQAVVYSVLRRAILNAQRFEVFEDHALPTEEALTLKLVANEQGLYDSQSIVESVKEHAHEIQVLHLSDLVFSTGQRLDIPFILSELKDVIKANHIIVGLDLAHTVGNRTIHLDALEVVTYAVGCGYKHCSGSAGSAFGLYVNKQTDLKKYPPIQGWKAADSSQVFGQINGFNPAIMATNGAKAFRSSNAAPVALAPIQTFVKHMDAIGWDKLTAKSECLTRYMLTLLKARLGETLQLITPEDPAQRGAMLVFRVIGLKQAHAVEDALKQVSDLGRFEVDTRPPNNIRVTAHYGYTSFADIQRMVTRLEQVVSKVLAAETLGV